MVYDPTFGAVVLFGGVNGGGLLRDTWMFRGGTWVRLLPHVSPPARRSMGMTYDARDGYVLVFGGLGSKDLSDTWTFTNGQWAELSPSVHPSARVAADLAYDPATGYVVLFGGRNDNRGTVLGDTWMFSGGNWTRIHSATHPAARQGASMVYDTTTRSIVLFGGWTSTVYGSGSQYYLNDTWEFG
jgi:Galactose oxidase, central domain